MRGHALFETLAQELKTIDACPVLDSKFGQIQQSGAGAEHAQVQLGFGAAEYDVVLELELALVHQRAFVADVAADQVYAFAAVFTAALEPNVGDVIVRKLGGVGVDRSEVAAADGDHFGIFPMRFQHVAQVIAMRNHAVVVEQQNDFAARVLQA
jgi:hypothetical protein